MRRYSVLMLCLACWLANPLALTHAQAGPGQQVTCRSGHYTLTAPRGWQVNLKGCANKNTPLLSAPDHKAVVSLYTDPAGSVQRMDVAALKAFFSKSKLTLLDGGYVIVHGITFTVGTLHLSDPGTQGQVTVYYGVTIRAHTAYTYLANVFSTDNPAYAQSVRVAKQVLTTVRLLPGH